LNHEGPWYGGIGPENKYLFNGIERVEELEINIDMAVFRSYDPAIGRWWQVDPIDKFNESLYVGFSNNPTTLSDYLGADTLRQIGPDTYDGGNVVDLVTVSAKRDGNNYDQSYIRYGFNGTYDQWQNRYGFQGWSYDNAMNYWNQAHSADFDRYVYTQDSIEKDRIFREKLWLFSGGWASIGSIYGLGGRAQTKLSPKISTRITTPTP
jgi:RHS repeat-associated protein